MFAYHLYHIIALLYSLNLSRRIALSYFVTYVLGDGCVTYTFIGYRRRYRERRRRNGADVALSFRAWRWRGRGGGRAA